MTLLILIGIGVIYAFLKIEGKKALTKQRPVQPNSYVETKNVNYGIAKNWANLSPADAEKEKLFTVAVTCFLFEMVPEAKLIDNLIDWEFVDDESTLRPHCNNFTNKIKLYYDRGDHVETYNAIITTEEVYKSFFPEKFQTKDEKAKEKKATEAKPTKSAAEIVAEWMSSEYLTKYLPALKKEGFINIPLTKQELLDNIAEIKRRIQLDSKINYEFNEDSHEIRLVYS